MRLLGVLKMKTEHDPWAPFRHRAYAVIWTATVVSNIGGWMYNAASGWLMVSASPLPIPIHLPFGFKVPNLTGPNALIEAGAKFTHEVLSKLVIGGVALHVAGALKHQFIDHDGVLSRMLPIGAGVARRRI